MDILALSVENVKKISAARIEPPEGLVVVTGKNGAGKSSLLDSIEMLFAGKSRVPSKPIQKGKARAHIIAEIGDRDESGEKTIRFIVKRNFTGDEKSYLTIESADGATYKSPQSMLDEFWGMEAFYDPYEFTRLSGKEQQEILARAIGLDLEEIDKRKEGYYLIRRDHKREVAATQAKLQDHPPNPEAPMEKAVVSQLLEELKKREEHNNEIDALESDALEAEGESKNAANEVTAIQEHIDQLQVKIQELRVQRKRAETRAIKAKASAEALRKRIGEMEAADTDEIREQISKAEEVNAAWESEQTRIRLMKEVGTLKGKIAGADSLIEQCNQEKATKISEAELPVEGLSFGEDGILLNGIPFEQSAQSEKLRVSLALGIAMRPELRVLLCRDGSLLDENSMKLIGGMVEEKGVQLWLERVAKDGEVGIMIEDGEVVANE